MFNKLSEEFKLKDLHSAFLTKLKTIELRSTTPSASLFDVNIRNLMFDYNQDWTVLNLQLIFRQCDNQLRDRVQSTKNRSIDALCETLGLNFVGIAKF